MFPWAGRKAGRKSGSHMYPLPAGEDGSHLRKKWPRNGTSATSSSGFDRAGWPCDSHCSRGPCSRPGSFRAGAQSCSGGGSQRCRWRSRSKGLRPLPGHADLRTSSPFDRRAELRSSRVDRWETVFRVALIARAVKWLLGHLCGGCPRALVGRCVPLWPERPSVAPKFRGLSSKVD